MQLTHNLQNLQQQLAIAVNASMMMGRGGGGGGGGPQQQQFGQQGQQFNNGQQQQQFNPQQQQQQFGMQNVNNGRSPAMSHARPVLTAEQLANERLLVNGRRRGLKREAPPPSDGAAGANKQQRF